MRMRCIVFLPKLVNSILTHLSCRVLLTVKAQLDSIFSKFSYAGNYLHVFTLYLHKIIYQDSAKQKDPRIRKSPKVK